MAYKLVVGGDCGTGEGKTHLRDVSHGDTAQTLVVSPAIVEYIQRFFDMGAFEHEADGSISVNPEVEQAFRAAHAVLSGASVTVSTEGGDEAKMTELQGLWKQAIESVKELDISEGDAPLGP